MKHTELISDIPEEERPYERCRESGPRVLSDSELLAVILRTGSQGESSIALARRILQSTGSYMGIAGICSLSGRDLEKIHGIGKAKAAQIQCVAELSRRIAMSAAEERLLFSSPKTVADYYMETVRHEKKEKVLLVMLDAKGRSIRDLELSSGTATSSLASPRDIFIEALRYEAVNIMLLHNHPSGDPTPSRDDIRLTKHLWQIGKILEIPLIDHIVIGDCRYVSFREEGMLL